MKKNHIIAALAIIAVAVLGVYLYSGSIETGPDHRALNLMRLTGSRPKAASTKEGQVAARVNGEVISVDEIKKGYDDNPQIAEQIPFDEFYKKAVDVFVNGKLLYQAAVKSKTMETPEYVEQLKIAKEDLARKIFLEESVEAKVTPAAVQAFYQNEYVAKFNSQKEMSAKHILVEDEAAAKKAIERLNNGEDFDAVAKEVTKDKTVELGYFTEDLMVPEFIAAVKTLKVGEYTKAPVKTQFGYHVVLLTDLRDSEPLPLSELEPQIKNILGQQAAAEIFDTLYKNSTIEKYDLDGNIMPEEQTEK